MIRQFLFSVILLLFPFSIFAMTEFVEIGGVSHTVESGIHTVRAEEQVPIIIEKRNLPNSFERISFSQLSYNGPVFFVWQPNGEPFDPNKYNMRASVENGNLYLPNRLERNNIETIGIIFPVGAISFRDITFGHVTFGEKFSRLVEGRNPLLPSTINLLYPKYLGSTPISKVLGILVIVLSLVLLFYKKHAIILVCISMWFLWDILYAMDQKDIIKITYVNFVAPAETEKRYFDLGDQYGFAKSVIPYEKPNLDYYAPRIWPFYLNFLYHAYPTTVHWQGTGASLVAVASVPWSLSGTSLTVEGNILPGEFALLEKYSESSYLFSRK